MESRNTRCNMCRVEVDPERIRQMRDARRLLCQRCEDLQKAPLCRYCGQPVRGLKRNDPEPYHENCRRCSSCYQVVKPKSVCKLAGRLLCPSCYGLFSQFIVPAHKKDSDRMRETFQAWDVDGSGSIEGGELRRVLKALDPDFADRDITKLIRSIDTNGNNLIEYNEFCEWITRADPLLVEEDGFEQLCSKLMRQAGKALIEFKMGIAEVQVRTDGIWFIEQSGVQRRETNSSVVDSLELMLLDPEEFISKVESNEHGFQLTMNTGRIASTPVQGAAFGPYEAPEGFHIIGLRTKPTETSADRVVGIDICPLAHAMSYDANASLRYSAEKEFLTTVRALVTGQEGTYGVDINSFTCGGATSLMIASQWGNVGAIRLLLQAGADANLADQDGWTALTYASKFGQANAVQLLLSKGAKSDGEGDGGAALAAALKGKHNSSARALLRAGFGPAPPGTFALETVTDPDQCSLALPRVSPASGDYSKPVSVVLSHDLEDVRILYTLDGRDPFYVGRRYQGPLLLRAESNRLRAVAVAAKHRSAELQATFGICHYAMPDEFVGGRFCIRTFPEATQQVIEALSCCLAVPRERLRITANESSEDTGTNWMRVALADPSPVHRLKIDRSFNLVKGNKKKGFIENFIKDVEKATGEAPEVEKIQSGSIVVNFSLSRAGAEEMRRQLADPASYLRSRAKLRASFADSKFLETENCLGDQINSVEIQSMLHGKLGRSAEVDEVVGIGSGDSGIIAIACPESQVKKLKKLLVKHVQATFPDAELEPVTVGPEFIDYDFTIDVVSGHQEDGTYVDGSSVMQKINDANLVKEVASALGQQGLRADVDLKERASSRPLCQLEFHLEWEFPEGGSSADYLDGICLIYQEEALAQVIDFRSASQDQHIHDGQDTRQAKQLCRAISRAVQHSGDVMSDSGGEHHMTLDLSALPLEVTDLYFVLAAFECKDLSQFRNPAVEIHDMYSNRELTEYKIDSAGETPAVIMCSLSRQETGKWIVKGLGIPCDGNVDDYGPIKAQIASLQARFESWERREDFVKLKVLHKLKRVTKASSSTFADLLMDIVNLPLPAFQVLMQML